MVQLMADIKIRKTGETGFIDSFAFVNTRLSKIIVEYNCIETININIYIYKYHHKTKYNRKYQDILYSEIYPVLYDIQK